VDESILFKFSNKMDLERASVPLFKHEFLAVLLAGFGNE
jgi:hypothetical protein